MWQEALRWPEGPPPATPSGHCLQLGQDVPWHPHALGDTHWPRSMTQESTSPRLLRQQIKVSDSLQTRAPDHHPVPCPVSVSEQPRTVSLDARGLIFYILCHDSPCSCASSDCCMAQAQSKTRMGRKLHRGAVSLRDSKTDSHWVRR